MGRLDQALAVTAVLAGAAAVSVFVAPEWFGVGAGPARPAVAAARRGYRASAAFESPARRVREGREGDVYATLFAGTDAVVAGGPTPLADESHASRAADPFDAFPATRPTTGPVRGSEVASADDDFRFVPNPRPDVPLPQTPAPSTTRNVDTNRPIHQWQRATDDWGGVRPGLEDRGVSFNARLTTDWSLALTGGANPRSSAFRGLFDANFTLDTERLVGLKGGTFFVNFQNQSGRDGSAVVGDAQGFSNIDADGRTQISELWYQQTLWDGKVRMKAGKIDANADFAAPANGAEFVQSSMGHSPTIPMPTYPDPATAVVAFITPSDAWYAGAGVFDGAGVRGVATGENGPATFLGSPAALFLIGEAGLRWQEAPDRHAGRLAVGGWHVTGDVPQLAGGASAGASGVYAVADQTLWRAGAGEDDKRGVGLFLQYGYADPSTSVITQHAGGGLAWTGPVPGRDSDVLGLGASYARFSTHAGTDDDGELAVELFYKIQITPFLMLKPDLQYVHNPGGVASQNDALVGTLRLSVDF